MAKRKPLTPTQIAYKKQVKRIKQFIRRAEKRGYQFQENVLPKQPKRITEQSVERLRKLTPEQLYKKAEYGGEASYGEIVKGTQGRQLERKASAQKASETRRARQELERLSRERQYEEYEIPEVPIEPSEGFEYDYEEDYNDEGFEAEDVHNSDASFYERVVISNYRNMLKEYNEEASQKLVNWLDAVRASQGDKAVAEMIQQAQEAGVGLERKDSYDSNKVQEYIGAMMDYLPEAGDFTKQEIMDALEYEESYEPPV